MNPAQALDLLAALAEDAAHHRARGCTDAAWLVHRQTAQDEVAAAVRVLMAVDRPPPVGPQPRPLVAPHSR